MYSLISTLDGSNVRRVHDGNLDEITVILLDFSLTVNAATLIFISGCGSAIPSAKEGKSGFIYIISFLSRANVRAFHENPNRLHSELTFIHPYSAKSQNVCFCCPLNYLKPHR